MAWGVFLDESWRIRTGAMGGVLGIESDRAVAKLVRAGVSLDAAEDFISACERGFVAALNEKKDEGDGSED